MKKHDWIDSQQEFSWPMKIGRYLLVAAVLTCFFLLNVAPLPLGQLEDIRPAFVLMAVYYWSIVRPDMMQLWVAFCAGAVLDILLGYPLGLHALIFTLVRTGMVRQRRYFLGQSFVMTWWGFAVIAGLAGAVQWMVMSLYTTTFASLLPVAAGIALSVALFPLFALMLHAAHRVLLHAEKPVI